MTYFAEVRPNTYLPDRSQEMARQPKTTVAELVHQLEADSEITTPTPTAPIHSHIADYIQGGCFWMDALQIVQRLGTRRFIDELAAQLAEVGNEVTQTRKKGKVTVVFTLSPGADDGVSLVVAEEIKRTPPVKNARGAFFFALDGELHDGDPRQTPMEFREVERAAGRVVTVDTSTGEVLSVKDAG